MASTVEELTGPAAIDPGVEDVIANAARNHMNPPAQDQTMVINMGPQHPSTHGVLRLVVEIDGETVVSLAPDIGYLHTGIEKTCEAKFYQQVVPLTDRIDYLCPMTNNLAYCLAVEKLLGLEIPERAQYLRVLLNELTRIQSHLVWLGTHAMDIGALTIFLYCWREREDIMRIYENVSGQRMMTSYFRVGGLALEPPLDFYKQVQDFLNIMPDRITQYENLLTGNPIWMNRLKGVGYLSAADAIALGVTGPPLRASGVDWDLRRDGKPYLVYPELDFKVWTHPDGDSFSRYWVRLQETREAARMVVQMLDRIPSGPIMAKVPRIIKVPEGEVWVETENPLGQMAYYVISKGATGPFRVKIRSASFSNVSILPWLLRGVYVPDVITVLASLYFILGDIDR